MSHPVFDLHCDTADRLAWQTLPEDLRLACGADFYGPGDGEDPAGCRELARNRCHVSLEAVGETPWAQCFACFIPDELAPEPAVRFYRHVAAYLEAEVQKNASAVALVSGADEIRPALQSGRMAAIRTVENARLFAADLGLVGTPRRAGRPHGLSQLERRRARSRAAATPMPGSLSLGEQCADGDGARGHGA